MSRYRVLCAQLNKRFELRQGERLFTELRKQDIPMASSCGGIGICTWCKIQVVAGSEHLNPLTTYEQTAGLRTNERLCCQVNVRGDIEIRTTYW